MKPLTILLTLLFLTPLFSIHTLAIQEFGCAMDESQYNTSFGCPSNIDVVTAPWVLDGWQTHHDQFIDLVSKTDKTPYLHIYAIAGLARRDQGLQDCNVGTPNLCQQGANYIRNNLDNIYTGYDTIASKLKTLDRKIYLHIEPDFYQYHHSNEQQNPLSLEESHTVLNSLANRLKDQLPNAILIEDVSPWNQNQKSWSSGLKGFNYGGIVGKQLNYGENVDGKTYSQIAQEINKPLIINTAHGPGGYQLDYNYSWDNQNSDNVYLLIQPSTNSQHYENYLTTINPKKDDRPVAGLSKPAPQEFQIETLEVKTHEMAQNKNYNESDQDHGQSRVITKAQAEYIESLRPTNN